jgi:uncharacterized protein (TIGR02145 family)
MKNVSLLIVIAFRIIAGSASAQDAGTITDSRDGKSYPTITLGSQTWMGANLAFNASNACRAYNDDVTNAEKYGYLYDYEMAKRLCPAGWHLPTDAEWKTLVTYLGGDKSAGAKLKDGGFGALAGGFRNGFGVYSGLGTHGMWWSSTWGNELNAWYRLLTFNSGKFEKRSLIKLSCFSVRCVKD